MKQLRLFAFFLLLLGAALLAGCQSRHYDDAIDRPAQVSDGTFVFEYDPAGNCYTLSSVKNKEAETLSLPATFEGKPVTAIGFGAFADCERLTKVTLPEGILRVEALAFQNCPTLSAVSLPASLEKVGRGAFWGCTALTDMTVAPGNTHLRMTSGCLVALEDKTVLVATKNATLPTDGSATVVGKGVFAQQTERKEILIPEGYTVIEDKAFEDCIALSSLSLPSTLTFIGYRAFYGCEALETLSLPAALQGSSSLGMEAFAGCKRLTAVTFAEGSLLTVLPERIFADCKKLQTVDFGDRSKLSRIGFEAFRGCSSLSQVRFGEESKLSFIGYSAFLSCSSLKNISLPATVKTLSAYAFCHCTRLRDIEYAGTEAQWNAVEKVSGWDHNTGGCNVSFGKG